MGRREKGKIVLQQVSLRNLNTFVIQYLHADHDYVYHSPIAVYEKWRERERCDKHCSIHGMDDAVSPDWRSFRFFSPPLLFPFYFAVLPSPPLPPTMNTNRRAG